MGKRGNPNLKKNVHLSKATEFNGNSAVIAQKKSAEKRKQNIIDERTITEIVNTKIKAVQSNGQNLIENSLDMLIYALSQISKMMLEKKLTLKDCALLATLIKTVQSLAGEDTLNINNNVIEPPKFYFTAPDENEKK